MKIPFIQKALPISSALVILLLAAFAPIGVKAHEKIAIGKVERASSRTGAEDGFCIRVGQKLFDLNTGADKFRILSTKFGDYRLQEPES